MIRYTRFQQQSGLVKVLLGTLLVVALICLSAAFYYGRVNRAEDPRVLEARELLRLYEKGLESDQYGSALSILRAMERIYANTAGYERSFELGVILNNKASVYLVKLETELLGGGEVDRQEMLQTLETAEEYTREAIAIYEQWIAERGQLSRQEIEQQVVPTFAPNDPLLQDVNLERVIQKRVDDLVLAQVETPRRLSVSYANLGVIERYKGNPETAKICYERAIALWERNYTARDNLNVLMNRPMEKRSIIDRLFPPERAAELHQ